MHQLEGQKIPEALSFYQFSCLVHDFFGNSKFQRLFSPIFLWTSVKTLLMESVGRDNQNVPLRRSNEPRSRTLSVEPVRLYNQKYQFEGQRNPEVVMEPVGHDGRNNPFQGQTSREAVYGFLVIRNYEVVMKPVRRDGQNGPFSRSNKPRSKYTHFVDYRVL
uniref:Uncharacterized protein n=1 Tax=Solanum lycopersicum TaxID=4081 RepID=A0A3Q7HW35_SOLLC